MEFLIHMQTHLPPGMLPEHRAQLMADEREHSDRLAADGILKRMWRVPGSTSNWGLWDAPDATVLHDALAALPLFPWLEMTVHALANHAFDPVASGLAMAGSARPGG
jgi:muconolactone D-isomerase